jgi:GR25 family glycosyltransferase involved in LPS biosynthesis
MNSAEDIHNILYINLDKRPDRNEMALQELGKFQWVKNPQRFPAVHLPNGAIGCSLSHIKCIELAKKMDWEHVMICEDDIKFTNPSLLTQNLNRFLESGVEWDVIMLAGNNAGMYLPSQPVNDISEAVAVKIQACQAATGYLVKKHYYQILLNNFKEGLSRFMREPTKGTFYAIDRFWFSLQNRDKWYLIYPLTVTQQSNHSDIEKRYTNYDILMLTLDKSNFRFVPRVPIAQKGPQFIRML